MKKLLLTTLLMLGTSALWAQMLPYQNPNLSAEQRAEDLISRLTLEEKTKLMMDTSPAIPRLGIPQFQWWNEALPPYSPLRWRWQPHGTMPYSTRYSLLLVTRLV